MKTFRQLAFLVCFSGVSFPAPGANEVGSAWAPGVSSGKGWIDVNKAHYPYSGEDAWEMGKGSVSSYTDSNMCWAAQSSNMLQYWQNVYVAAGNVLPAGVPNGYIGGRENKTRRQYQIFEYFIENWTDDGGSAEYGIPWYFSGGFYSEVPTGLGWSEYLGGAEKGGFFKNIYPTAENLKNSGDFLFYTYSSKDSSNTFNSLKGFSSLLINSLQDAVVGLNIYVPQSSGTSLKHAVTVWGCDYDAAGIVTKIYLTDSDDGEVALKSFALSENSGSIYLTDYAENGLTRIQDFSMLSVGDFLPIPEPSAFSLTAGTLMLGLAACRRRRKI